MNIPAREERLPKQSTIFWEKFVNQYTFPVEELNTLKHDHKIDMCLYFDYKIKAIVLRWQNMLLTQDFEPQVFKEVKAINLNYPKTWFEAFKETFKDTWWFRNYVKKHPVKKTGEVHRVEFTITVNPKALFHELSNDLPKDKVGKPVIIYEFNKGWDVVTWKDNID